MTSDEAMEQADAWRDLLDALDTPGMLAEDRVATIRLIAEDRRGALQSQWQRLYLDERRPRVNS